MTFREYLNQAKISTEEVSSAKITEAVDTVELNSTGIGYIVSKTLATAAQVHIWHLLAKSGQKHVALGAFYGALESEIDGLAEKFLAIGGVLGDFSYGFTSTYSDTDIVIATREFRDEVSGVISQVTGNPDLQSMLDGLVDIQEAIDNFTYQFKLD